MKLHPNITPNLQSWISQQHIFFVATAPSRDGHVNVSPKGYSSLRIMDDHTVCYQDMTGSGNETSAHVEQNGRITIMFCGVEGGPRILRLYGKGEIVLRTNVKRWKELSQRFSEGLLPGTRQIVVNHVDRVQTSCGYAVPYMEYKGDREMLKGWAEGKSQEEIQEYQRNNNILSIDGIKTPLGELLVGGGGGSIAKMFSEMLIPSIAVLIGLVCVVSSMW